MITSWKYNLIGGERPGIKALIKDNNYRSVDVGGSCDQWSYPECDTVIDLLCVRPNTSKLFKLNLESDSSLSTFLPYIEDHGKFDFSICSHTLEDLFDPTRLIKFLTTISKAGFIAVPSKYNEFKYLYGHAYRGNAHHKQFFDVKDNKLVIYPKLSFIETDARSNELLADQLGDELNVYWKDDIDYKVFGSGEVFNGDDALISAYYKEILG